MAAPPAPLPLVPKPVPAVAWPLPPIATPLPPIATPLPLVPAVALPVPLPAVPCDESLLDPPHAAVSAPPTNNAPKPYANAFILTPLLRDSLEIGPELGSLDT